MRTTTLTIPQILFNTPKSKHWIIQDLFNTKLASSSNDILVYEFVQQQY